MKLDHCLSLTKLEPYIHLTNIYRAWHCTGTGRLGDKKILFYISAALVIPSLIKEMKPNNIKTSSKA